MLAKFSKWQDLNLENESGEQRDRERRMGPFEWKLLMTIEKSCKQAGNLKKWQSKLKIKGPSKINHVGRIMIES